MTPVTTEAMTMRLLMATIQPHGPWPSRSGRRAPVVCPLVCPPEWLVPLARRAPARTGCVAESGHEEHHARVAVADFADPPVRHALACRPGSRDLDRGRAPADVICRGGHPVSPVRQCVAGLGRRR